MIYTVKNMVVENNELVYNDGIIKIFLYTKGEKGGSKKLKNLLTYFENTIPSNAVDEDLAVIQKIVGNIKNQKEVGERYMTLQEMIDYEKRDSYKDGLIQGSIKAYQSLKQSKKQAKNELVKQYELTPEQAEKYIEFYWQN